MLKRFGGIAAVIVVGLGFFAFNMIKEKTSAPEVGDCVESFEDSVKDHKVACTAKPSADGALLKIVSVDTKSATAKCAKGAVALPNVTRGTTFCAKQLA